MANLERNNPLDQVRKIARPLGDCLRNKKFWLNTALPLAAIASLNVIPFVKPSHITPEILTNLITADTATIFTAGILMGVHLSKKR